jgi:ABC-type antimicrobial peptide transport system permease subunit
MLKNYFRSALRNLVRHRFSAALNIGGLSVGMAVAMLIGLWIHDEISFNKVHNNYDRIGQVNIHNGDGTYQSLPIPLADELRSNYRDDFDYVVLASQPESHLLAAGDKKFEQSGAYMQPDAPRMLTLDMRYGSSDGLRDPHAILLVQSLAKKLFGDADPSGRIITLDDKTEVKVTGVYQDLPDNSTFKDVAFIAPWDLFVATNDWVKASLTDWKQNAFDIFVQCKPGRDPDKIAARIRDIKIPHISKEKAAKFKPAVFIQPMSKWHLYSRFENRVNVTSEALKFVWFYGIIGAFVLLLACINFMNLSTARSEKRAREVGVRKAIGSSRGQLIGQFFMESLLMAACSFLLAIVLVQLSLFSFNEIAGKTLSIPFFSPMFWLAGLLFIAITGFLAGSYPALYLSSFNAINVLKSASRVGRFAENFVGAASPRSFLVRNLRALASPWLSRKVLVVLQFTVSIALIIGTLVVYRQIQYAKDRPVGYSREGLLTIPMKAADIQAKYDALKNELKNTGAVAQMAESGAPITYLGSETGGIDWVGRDPATESSFGTVPVSDDYGKTVGWSLAQGRDFSKGFASDSSGFVINEAAAKYMGLKDPLKAILTWKKEDGRVEQYRILGVVKDVVMNSPFEPAYPTVFFLNGGMSTLFIRLDATMSAGVALTKISAVFKKLFPAAPFDYAFVDEDYGRKFAAEERTGKIAACFASLAIFISCLGLFGMASFTAERRIKEIGVRKVLGASLFQLWGLLTRDFVVLVGLAFVLATPPAWYFLHAWLQQYEYRAPLSAWIFFAAGAGALFITILTVSFQAIKAAAANPAKNLRTE